MSTTITDLNNHLFKQLERLTAENMTAEQIDIEVKRADAVVAVSDQLIASANLHLKAVAIVATHGDRFKPQLKMIEGNAG